GCGAVEHGQHDPLVPPAVGGERAGGADRVAMPPLAVDPGATVLGDGVVAGQDDGPVGGEAIEDGGDVPPRRLPGGPAAGRPGGRGAARACVGAGGAVAAVAAGVPGGKAAGGAERVGDGAAADGEEGGQGQQGQSMIGGSGEGRGQRLEGGADRRGEPVMVVGDPTTRGAGLAGEAA